MKKEYTRTVSRRQIKWAIALALTVIGFAVDAAIIWIPTLAVGGWMLGKLLSSRHDYKNM